MPVRALTKHNDKRLQHREDDIADTKLVTWLKQLCVIVCVCFSEHSMYGCVFSVQ